jgi:hypothetical protein
MPTVDVSLNILTLFFIVLGAGLLGFILRGGQLRKKQLKIMELKNEMVSNHAQILDLERECVSLESKLRETKTPVLPMKIAVSDQQVETRGVR